MKAFFATRAFMGAAWMLEREAFAVLRAALNEQVATLQRVKQDHEPTSRSDRA